MLPTVEDKTQGVKHSEEIKMKLIKQGADLLYNRTYQNTPGVIWSKEKEGSGRKRQKNNHADEQVEISDEAKEIAQKLK